MGTAVKPYEGSLDPKKQQVAQMFDNIAGNYDFMNRFLTAGADVRWRNRVVGMLRPRHPKIVVDIATGTGDFALAAAKLKPERIIGIDISEGMLEVGRRKVEKAALAGIVEMRVGDSENLDLPDNFADAITVGFGVRNFENLQKGLGEIHRVLKPGGVAVVLEPSFPTKPPMKQLFKLYFNGVMPLLGRALSRDTAAYGYLSQSVRAFPAGSDFLAICHIAGFRNTRWIPLTFGSCALYWLEK